MDKYFIKHIRPGLQDKGYRFNSYVNFAVKEAKLTMEAGKYVNCPKIYKYYGYVDQEVKDVNFFEDFDDDAINEHIMNTGVDFRDECIVMEKLQGCLALDKYIETKRNNYGEDGELLKAGYVLIKRVQDEIKKLHENNIIHGDVNLGNILYNEDEDKIWIIDYECCMCDNIDDDRKEAEILHIEYYMLRYIIKLLSEDDMVIGIGERIKYLNDIVWY